MKIAVTTFVVLIAIATQTSYGAPQEQGYNYAAPAVSASPSYSYTYVVDEVDNGGQPVKFGHQETHNGARTEGTYYVLLPDSRVMTVNYYADETGFHPSYTFQGQAVYPQAAAPATLRGQAALAAPQQLYTPPATVETVLAQPQQLHSAPAFVQEVLATPQGQNTPVSAQAVLAIPQLQQQRPRTAAQVVLAAPSTQAVLATPQLQQHRPLTAAQVVLAAPKLQYRLAAGEAEPSQLYNSARGK